MASQFKNIFAACLMTAVLVPAGAWAQDDEDDGGRAAFAAIIAANTHPIQLEDNVLSGEGFGWLMEEGAQAQYFLIGERHGLAEIPPIAAQMFEGLVPHGYTHAALEFGPFAADRVNEQLQAGGYPALAEYLSSPDGYMSVAFLDWVEEAQMAARIHAASPLESDVIWGLDQEFGMAAYAHFLHLNGLAQSDALKASTAEQMVQAREIEFYLADVPEDVLTNMRTSFVAEGSTEAVALLDDMILSRHVYGPWARPRRLHISTSNIVREDYMSQNFLDEVMGYQEQSGENPRVFMKFGGNHSSPSIDSRNGRYALGMMAEYMARIEGESAFNIFIDCHSGHNLTSGQDEGAEAGEEQACSSVFGSTAAPGDDPDGSNIFSPWLHEREGAFLVDLRPIRMTMADYDFLDDDEKGMLIGFDAFLALPGTTSAGSFPSPFADEAE